MQLLKKTFQQSVNHFTAGQVKYRSDRWREFTSNNQIIQTICGVKIPFIGPPPSKSWVKTKLFRN